MTKHEIKDCQRCKGSFECKVGNVLECQCSELSLSDDQKKIINDRFNDCLCKKCLFELSQEYHIDSFNKILHEAMHKIARESASTNWEEKGTE